MRLIEILQTMALKRKTKFSIEEKMKEHKLTCTCGTVEHSWFFCMDRGDHDELYMTTFLATRPFFWRVKNAIKYIFGYKCLYGHFDETIIDVKEAKKLVEFFNEFISSNEKEG